jgi:hypothetical protein
MATETHHDDIGHMWAHAILLEESWVHMPCILNDQNDLIWQLLQVPQVCYDALHKDTSSNPLLIAYHVVHFAGWSDASTTLNGFLKAENLVFCLFMNSLRWKWPSSLNNWQSKVVGYHCAHCNKSQQNSYFCCLLAAVSICTT